MNYIIVEEKPSTVKCQSLIGMVLILISNQYRDRLTYELEVMCQSLIGMVLILMNKYELIARLLADKVSIPYRYGTYTCGASTLIITTVKVSIPYRYGTYTRQHQLSRNLRIAMSVNPL